MTEKIDINKLRGEYHEYVDPMSVAGGDDTRKSLKVLGDKINEIIDYLDSRETTVNFAFTELGSEIERGSISGVIGHMESILAADNPDTCPTCNKVK